MVMPKMFLEPHFLHPVDYVGAPVQSDRDNYRIGQPNVPDLVFFEFGFLILETYHYSSKELLKV